MSPVVQEQSRSGTVPIARSRPLCRRAAPPPAGGRRESPAPRAGQAAYVAPKGGMFARRSVGAAAGTACRGCTRARTQRASDWGGCSLAQAARAGRDAMGRVAEFSGISGQMLRYIRASDVTRARILTDVLSLALCGPSPGARARSLPRMWGRPPICILAGAATYFCASDSI